MTVHDHGAKKAIRTYNFPLSVNIIISKLPSQHTVCTLDMISKREAPDTDIPDTDIPDTDIPDTDIPDIRLILKPYFTPITKHF